MRRVKLKANTVIATLLCLLMIVFLVCVRLMTFYQHEDVEPMRANPERLPRCADRPRVPWTWDDTQCPSKLLRIGVVRTGDEIADYVEHTLLRDNCVGSIIFETFSAEEVDEFESLDLYPIHLNGWILYGGHFDTPTRWPRLPLHGVIGLSEESCFNGTPANVRARFGFMTYGDCAITDGIDFFTFPLGPYAVDHPSFLDSTPVKPPTQRATLLNAQFTMTPRKPSRRLWLEKAQSFCVSRDVPCQTGVDWVYAAGVSSLFSRSDSYVAALRDSVFTLCPSGNNFEQYRIWEAIFSGSIPIVEDVAHELRHPQYTSPSYGAGYYCVPDDVHYVLKQSDAPVLFASTLGDLAVRLEESRELVDTIILQLEMMKWKERLFEHYRRLLVRMMLKHFV